MHRRTCSAYLYLFWADGAHTIYWCERADGEPPTSAFEILRDKCARHIEYVYAVSKCMRVYADSAQPKVIRMYVALAHAVIRMQHITPRARMETECTKGGSYIFRCLAHTQYIPPLKIYNQPILFVAMMIVGLALIAFDERATLFNNVGEHHTYCIIAFSIPLNVLYMRFKNHIMN